MYRKLLIFNILWAILLLSTSVAGAQEKKNRFGIRVGYTLGTQIMDPDPADFRGSSHDFTSGFLAGITLDRPFLGNLTYSIELLYMTTGDKFKHEDQDNIGTERESEFSNAFIVLPVLYKYHFGNYYLSAGPEMSFLVSAKQKPFVTELLGLDVTDTSELLKSTTWAIILGVGFEYSAANSPLTFAFDFRYSQSMQSYNKDDNFAFPIGTDFNYKILRFSLGVRF